MTKKELIENEAFINAPMEAVIELPNWHYGMDGDEREDVQLSEVHYWDWLKLITLK